MWLKNIFGLTLYVIALLESSYYADLVNEAQRCQAV